MSTLFVNELIYGFPLKNLIGKIALLEIRIMLLCKEQRSLSGYINCTNCSGISLNNTAIRIIIGLAPITQLCTSVMKIVHIQGRSPNVVSDFPYHKELLIKERICSLWEQILSFKRSSHFEKGHD